MKLFHNPNHLLIQIVFCDVVVCVFVNKYYFHKAQSQQKLTGIPLFVVEMFKLVTYWTISFPRISMFEAKALCQERNMF